MPAGGGVSGLDGEGTTWKRERSNYTYIDARCGAQSHEVLVHPNHDVIDQSIRAGGFKAGALPDAGDRCQRLPRVMRGGRGGLPFVPFGKNVGFLGPWTPEIPYRWVVLGTLYLDLAFEVSRRRSILCLLSRLKV